MISPMIVVRRAKHKGALLLVDLENKPKNYSSLIFGDYGKVARLEIGGDTSFKKLAETDEANFWGLNLVSCSSDRWDDIPQEGLSKFQKTIAYQTVMDSLVPDVFVGLSEIVTDPWGSYLYSRISTMEKVHAMSYSSGISQAFGAKAEQFLDIIYTDPKIKARVKNEIEVAERFVDAVKAGWEETEENKKLLVELLYKTLYLEGVKFPFSFFTSWTINKAFGNVAQGFSQLLIKISIDEMQVHTTTGVTFLKKLVKNPKTSHLFTSDWFKDSFTEYVRESVEDDLLWVDHLLEDGEIAGFNKEICDHFIKYWADYRLKSVGLGPIYNVTKNDIEVWFDSYRNVNDKHSALQEIDSVTYQKNTLVNDLYKFDKQ